MSAQILSVCSIKNHTVWVNGKAVFTEKNSDAEAFLKSAFSELNESYSKFYKMDNLAKLGFVATEFALKFAPEISSETDVAQHFVNHNSSADADWKHQELILQQKSPSPAIFVYTLPNILLGELAIKHKWYGENLFTLATHFSLEKWLHQAERWFALDKAEMCIGGWVEYLENNAEAHVFLVSKEAQKSALNSDEWKQHIPH